jgi:hypothetical protein
MHAAKLLKVLDRLSSVQMSISHVGVAFASSADASTIDIVIIDRSALLNMLVHAQFMIVLVMLYCKLVGVPGAPSITRVAKTSFMSAFEEEIEIT